MSGTAIASRGISERLALTQRGEVHYFDFPARLAALVPPPRVHLTRYHGVFARMRRCAVRSRPRAEG